MPPVSSALMASVNSDESVRPIAQAIHCTFILATIIFCAAKRAKQVKVVLHGGRGKCHRL